MNKGYNENELATVRGLRGLRHGTLNQWDNTHNKLVALCGISVSPNYRSLTLASVDCPKCKELILGTKG